MHIPSRVVLTPLRFDPTFLAPVRSLAPLQSSDPNPKTETEESRGKLGQKSGCGIGANCLAAETLAYANAAVCGVNAFAPAARDNSAPLANANVLILWDGRYVCAFSGMVITSP